MRRIIGIIGATLAIVALMAVSAGSALADSHNEGPHLFPDVFYDNTDVFASTAVGGANGSLTQPCDPCGMDGGTGTELLFAVDDFALVDSEPLGGSPTPTSNPVLTAALT